MNDAIDPVPIDFLGTQIKAELLAHHAGKEAADRICCQWVARMVAAIVAPSVRPSIASTRACFEPGWLPIREPPSLFAFPG